MMDKRSFRQVLGDTAWRLSAKIAPGQENAYHECFTSLTAMVGHTLSECMEIARHYRDQAEDSASRFTANGILAEIQGIANQVLVLPIGAASPEPTHVPAGDDALVKAKQLLEERPDRVSLLTTLRPWDLAELYLRLATAEALVAIAESLHAQTRN